MSTALNLPITGDMNLDDVMTAHRLTIPVFIRRRMMCVGCPVARLHDVSQACREHAVPLPDFLAEVNGAIADDA